MNNNLYKAKLIEIKGNIKKLEDLNINIDDFKKSLDKVEEETNEKIEKTYLEYSTTVTDTVINNLLVRIYSEAVNKIENINNLIISKYESIYKLRMQYINLDNLISDNFGNVNDSEVVEKIIRDTIDLLKYMKKIPFMNFKDIDYIISDIYSLVYKAIKLELMNTNHSLILSYVKSSEDDIFYIAKLIKSEIDDNNSKQRIPELEYKISNIKLKGLSDANYLDEELIVLLCIESNYYVTDSLKDKFFSKLSEYDKINKDLEDLKIKKLDIKDTLVKLKKEKSKINLKRGFHKAIFLINLGIVCSGIIKAASFVHDNSYDTLYRTVTITYDTSMEKEVVEEYLEDTNNSVSLIEYSAWEGPGYFRNDYKRNVYTYDLSYLDTVYENIEDYLNPDLKGKIIVSNTTSETTEEEPDDFNTYSNNKYVIKTVIQYDEDLKKVFNQTKTICVSLIISMLIILLDYILYNVILGEMIDIGKNERKDNNKNLKENKQLLLETKKSIIELNNKLNEINKNIKKDYEELPIIVQKNDEIKEKIKKIDENKW